MYISGWEYGFLLAQVKIPNPVEATEFAGARMIPCGSHCQESAQRASAIVFFDHIVG